MGRSLPLPADTEDISHCLSVPGQVGRRQLCSADIPYRAAQVSEPPAEKGLQAMAAVEREKQKVSSFRSRYYKAGVREARSGLHAHSVLGTAVVMAGAI